MDRSDTDVSPSFRDLPKASMGWGWNSILCRLVGHRLRRPNVIIVQGFTEGGMARLRGVSISCERCGTVVFCEEYK